MDTSAAPHKCIELSSFPIKDVKTRRLFILSDGRRSIDQIIGLSGLSDDDALALIQDFIKKGFLGFERLDTVKNSSYSSTEVGADRFLEQVTESLAQLVGPFAKVALGEFSFSSGPLSPSMRQEVINVAIQEIEGTEDREAFLSGLRNAGLI